MCAKLRQPVLVCVRRVSGGQPGLAPSRSWLASCQTPRLLPTKNAFAALAAKRGGVPATPSTGGWKDLTENCCPFSSLSPRRLHATRPPSSSDAVASPVSQREATSGVPASLVSDPPDSSISRSRSSSSGNGGSSKESRSNSSNSESSGSGSKSECREGAIGGRDETAEVQRLLRERHQRQADVIPFKIRRTASDNLPVNLSWSHSRSQVRTVIRKVGGDRQVFMRELAVLCQSPVWEGEGCICVSGNKKAIVRQWLQELGF